MSAKMRRAPCRWPLSRSVLSSETQKHQSGGGGASGPPCAHVHGALVPGGSRSWSPPAADRAGAAQGTRLQTQSSVGVLAALGTWG